ncbi:MAG: exodeoxyribonuclease VII small subunit [Glaciecola sp.]|jgi:exodeoxyribonuclease VII small subunit
MSDAPELNFEQAMQQLETIVNQMEQGELPLAEALAKFEQGIKLARTSQSMLKNAEQKVQMLAADHMNLEDFPK